MKDKTMNPHKYMIVNTFYENDLYQLFGLRINKSSVLRYIDAFPENEEQYTRLNPKVFTCDFIDETGYGWANANSNFYKLHTLKKSSLFKEFKEFKSTYTFKLGQYWLT